MTIQAQPQVEGNSKLDFAGFALRRVKSGVSMRNTAEA
jgi:hypothetical protein